MAVTTPAGHIRRNDARSRAHPPYRAFLWHRLSGLALALFLPVHFWALGQALHGEAALQGLLSWTDQPLFKLAEWGLVVLLTVHLVAGVRVLLIEFRPWAGPRRGLITLAAMAGSVMGAAFLLSLWL